MGKENVVLENMKLLPALLALQFCFAGFHIVSRVALNIGISKVVYPVYRNIIALILLGPFAYFLKDRPPLTFSLLVQFFLLALLGIPANQGFYLLGLYYASPTFASAMQNPVTGTTASVGGATTITLFKCLPLLHQKLTQGNMAEEDATVRQMQNWTWGCIYLLGHCLSWADWMVLQAPILKKYPAKLTLTSFTCFFGLIQFLVIVASMETDTERWKIQSGEELFTILYTGIVASVVFPSLQTWCIQKGGPVIVTVFQPVQTLLIAVTAIFLFGDQLYSGRPLGAALIMVGLYAVSWGKTEEKRMEIQQKEETLTKHLLEASAPTEDGRSHVDSDVPSVAF